MFNPLHHVGDALSGLIEGDVWLDSETRERYSTATCMYKIVPIGVVAPRHEHDVVTLVRFCAANGISITPRGGATGLVGQAIGSGIVVDMAAHLNRILSIDETPSTVTAQPGCILNDLFERLADHGLMYPVDPQSMRTCTVGGTIATNASGPHGIRYGATKDHLERVTMVLSNGDIATITKDSVEASQPSSQRMFATAREILERNAQIIRARAPKVSKNSSGYNVFDAIAGDTVNFLPLVCGSEGTLGIITEATLRLQHPPAQRVTAVVYCSSYELTGRTVQRALEDSPAAIELLDKSYTDIGRGIDPAIDELIAPAFQAMLIIEMDGEVREAVLNRLNSLLSALLEQKLILTCQIVRSERDRTALWKLREEVSNRLNREQERYQKASFIEDGTVPVEHLPAYLSGLTAILEKYAIPFSLYGHAGAGNIHCATFVEFTESGMRAIEAAAVDVFDLILSLHGSFSGEHGDGFVRTPFMEMEFGPEIYRIYTEVKGIFDPETIFNPGRIVGKQDGNFLHDVKYAAA